jgi:hypothetical protein
VPIDSHFRGITGGRGQISSAAIHVHESGERIVIVLGLRVEQRDDATAATPTGKQSRPAIPTIGGNMTLAGQSQGIDSDGATSTAASSVDAISSDSRNIAVQFRVIRNNTD